jgi:hypothetical protein
MSGDHNMYQKTKSYLNDDFECPRCGHCCQSEVEWVGLTDEEVSDVIDGVLEGGGWLDVARALEAAIKNKNKW